jgi:hypothetical protein
MLATCLTNTCRLPAARRFTILFLFAVAASLLLFATPVNAVTNIVVNDTWIDGNDMEPFSNNSLYGENNGVVGTDADSDGNLESAWFQGGGGTLDPVGPNGPLRGTVLTSSSSWETFFTQEATPVQLALAGDSIKVTWKFSLTTINVSNTSQGFNMALVDSPEGSRLIANGSTIDGAYRGYRISANMGQTLGNSSPFQLRKRSISSGNLLASSGNWTAVGTTGAASGNDGYDENVDYTLTWQITRNASDGLDIDVKMEGGTLDNDGTAQVTFTDTTPVGNDEITGPFGSFSFDTFAVRPSSGGQTGGLSADTFDTKLFKVEFTTSAVVPGTNGDFNNDTKVDAGDYATWRKNNGTNNALANDNGLGTPIGPNHYTLWRSNFGNPPGAGSGLAGAAVPEPNTMILMLGGMIGALRVRRRS